MPPPLDLGQQHPNIAKLQQILQALGPLLTKTASAYQGAAGPKGQGTPGAVPQPSPPQLPPPRVSYDTSGATGQLPMPQASPTKPGYSPSPVGGAMMAGLDPTGKAVYSAVEGVSKLLQDYESRKDQKEHAEAANIAQNLMVAMQNNDVATVHDILNDKHSRKVLDKVYKGWLTKAQEAQKPGEKPDPAVSGFEDGLKKTVEAKSQQQQPTQMPQTMAGYRLPQAGPAEQLGAAKLSAETQAAKQDPNRLLESQLTSAERRETELGAGPEKVAAEKAKYDEMTKKAIADYQRAAAEQKKAESELELKRYEAEAAKEKGKVSLDIEQKKLLEAQTKLETERARLQLVVASGGGKRIAPPINTQNQWNSLLEAQKAVEALLKSPPSWHFGAPPQELRTLQSQLRMAGLASLSMVIPSQASFFGKVDVPGMLTTIKEELSKRKDSLQQGFKDLYPKWQVPGVEAVPGGDKAGARGALPPDDTGDEGDDVDADYIVDEKGNVVENPNKKP
jgi:hypothetical protein